MRPRILVVDMNALFRRAYHSVKLEDQLTTSQGFPISATYTSIKTILSHVKQYKPTYVVMCDDCGRSFRKDWSIGYKSSRPPMTPDMLNQKTFLAKGLEEIGIPILLMEHFEADDLIATIVQCPIAFKPLEGESTLLENPHFRILTVDNDLVRLVDNDRVEVFVWNSFSKYTRIYTDHNEYLEKWGCTSKQLTDAKALLGDSSDNVDGVKGFGPKAVANFFQKYSSLKEAHDNGYTKLSDRHKKLLFDSEEQIKNSYKLVRLYTVKDSMVALYQIERYNYPSVFCNVLEFNSLVEPLKVESWVTTTLVFGIVPNDKKDLLKSPSTTS